MFGIGTSEFFVIIIVAVLVLGPEHLPRIMRTVNKIMSDFRKVSTDFQRTINLEAYTQEQKAAEKPTTKKKKKKKQPAPEPAQQEPAAPPADELAAEAHENTQKSPPSSVETEKNLSQTETDEPLHSTQPTTECSHIAPGKKAASDGKKAPKTRIEDSGNTSSTSPAEVAE